MRFAGYRKALAGQASPRDERIAIFRGLFPGGRGADDGHASPTRADAEAVFCVNNLVFIGAMKTVQKHETETGRSIMMAAFDIDRYCEIFKRPLLCANQDQEKLASNAVALLVQGIQNAIGPDRHLVVPMSIGRHRIR